jgi:hypothetical protein
MASLPPKPDAVSVHISSGDKSDPYSLLLPRSGQAEAARLSTASNAGKAASTVNKYAKRDPALYPLIIIVGGIFATAGYMLSTWPSRALVRRNR